ncbi:hypothetical protein PO909_023468 [Leuciscus waleckii]
MARTYSWRHYPREIIEGMSVEDVLKKYPFLRMPAGFFDEVDRIHPSPNSFCHRFREGFASVLPNVLKLARTKSILAVQQYTEARQDALAEDIPGIDLNEIEHYITMREGDPASPFPTIQLMDKDWKTVITGRGLSVVNVDGIDVCQCTSLDEAFITAFCMYFTFNIAYPPHLKNTQTFLQRRIVNIVEEGDKPLPKQIEAFCTDGHPYVRFPQSASRLRPSAHSRPPLSPDPCQSRSPWNAGPSLASSVRKAREMTMPPHRVATPPTSGPVIPLRCPTEGMSVVPMTLLVQFLGAWLELPNLSRWVERTIRLSYAIQFAQSPPRFRGVRYTMVGGNAPVMPYWRKVRSRLSL